jgi:endoglucanase
VRVAAAALLTLALAPPWVTPVALSAVGAPTHAAAASPDDAARAAAHRFLADYVDADGRVVRRDQGGDTVGEGQAYALWMAAAIGDEDRFRLVWSWTVEHLVNADGLLALRWDGDIVDAMPATDADLIAAAALSLAGERFGDSALSEVATRLGERILRLEADGSLLLAGPWAQGSGTINPSYFVLPAMSQLWRNGDHVWSAVATRSREVLGQLTASPPHLPPDWAVVYDGMPTASPSPRGESARFGYDAVRVVVQLAADCDKRSRELAAASWPFFADAAAGAVEAVHSLDGDPLVSEEHPTSLLAAAAAAHAAGDLDAASRLLDRATALDDSRPSYYGAAWIALTRLLLDTELLTSCAPG